MRRSSIDTRRGYDLWAPRYDVTDNPVVALDDVLMPPLVESLGLLEGRRVVDAGCGTGRHTAWLARRAAQVVALDFSDGMLDQARGRLGDAGNVAFIQQDLGQTPYASLAEGSVDGVLCALVGEHIADLPAFFGEVRRMLALGGWVAFSVYHPFLALQGKEANFLDPDSQVEYRLGAHKHLVCDYIDALRGAGLQLGRLHEVVVTSELCEAVPLAARFLDRPALFLLTGHL